MFQRNEQSSRHHSISAHSISSMPGEEPPSAYERRTDENRGRLPPGILVCPILWMGDANTAGVEISVLLPYQSNI